MGCNQIYSQKKLMAWNDRIIIQDQKKGNSK